ncbi:hypothetical protein PLICRDRAFT_611372 [Plicaturopsis crispa FD-325 SS-3]|nr:hypothetical protein PLICRDRAFT_611372 [Plicaturopsis crispa FD-325 SS-3]
MNSPASLSLQVLHVFCAIVCYRCVGFGTLFDGESLAPASQFLRNPSSLLLPPHSLHFVLTATDEFSIESLVCTFLCGHCVPCAELHRYTSWARSTTQASRSPHNVHGRCARSRRLWRWKIRNTWQRSSCSLDARFVPTHPFRLVNFA